MDTTVPDPLAPRRSLVSGRGPGGPLVTLRTLIIGAVGGFCGYMVGLPLGWMLGAMAATIPLAMAGVPMTAQSAPRSAMIVVIGLMVGSTFTPEIAARVPEWGATLLGVLLYVAIASVVNIWFCWKIGKLPPATAACSGTPGGLSEMIIMGPSLGADVRSISLVHGSRLVVLIGTVPLALSMAGLVESGAGQGMSRTIDWNFHLTLGDLAVLTACAILGVLLAKKLRFPAAALTGPLLLSAAAHLFGLTEAHVPDALLAAAQVVIGASIGQHFVGIERRTLVTGFALGTILTIFSLGLAAIFAFAFQVLLGVSFAIGLLALVPGGLPEMSVIAISLRADPAFVSLHHLFRVVLILVLAPFAIPLWVRALEKRQKRGA